MGRNGYRIAILMHNSWDVFPICRNRRSMQNSKITMDNMKNKQTNKQAGQDLDEVLR